MLSFPVFMRPVMMMSWTRPAGAWFETFSVTVASSLSGVANAPSMLMPAYNEDHYAV